MDTIFYHYALADPRIDDPIQRVRYIGRSTVSIRRRFWAHRSSAKRGKKSHHDHWIRQLQELRLEPILIDLGAGPDWRETQLILHWRHLGAPLTNHSNGGEKSPGFKETEETKAIRRQKGKEIWERPGYREQMAVKMQAVTSCPEYRAKMSKSVSAALARPEVKTKLRNSLKRHYENPENLERRRLLQREILSRPEVRAQIYSPEKIIKSTERLKKLQQQPEFWNKVREGIRAFHADPARHEQKIARWQETARKHREADPRNEAIRQMVLAGRPIGDMVQELSLGYGCIDRRIHRMRESGELPPVQKRKASGRMQLDLRRQVRQMLASGVPKVEISRQLAISYHSVYHQQVMMKDEGLL